MGADDFKDLAAAARILNARDIKELQEHAKEASEMIEAMRGGPLEQALRDAAAAQEAILGGPLADRMKEAVRGTAAFQEAFTRSAAAVAEQVETMRATHAAIVGDQSNKAMQQRAEAASQLVKDFGMSRFLEVFDTIESARAAASRMVEANAAAFASAIESTRLAFEQPQWDLSSSIAGLRSELEAAARVRAEIASIEELRSMTAAYLGSMSEVASRLAAVEWPVTLEVTEFQHHALSDMRASLEQYESLREELKNLIPAEDSLADTAITTPDEPIPPLMLPDLPAAESGLAIRLARGVGMRELSLAKVCLGQRLWKEAEHHSSEAAEWLPEHPEPYVGRGIALNALGRFDESIAAFALAEEKGADFSSRPDVRSVYEASLQHRRWDGQVVEEGADKPKN